MEEPKGAGTPSKKSEPAPAPTQSAVVPAAPASPPTRAAAQKHVTVPLLIVGGALVLLIGAAAALYLLRPDMFSGVKTILDHAAAPADSERSESIEDARALVDSGAYAEAQKVAWNIVRDTRGADGVALTIFEASAFMTGSPTARVSAIRATKEHYLRSEGNPYEQSMQVNKILGYINSAREPYVFDEVFVGEPFQRYLVPDDRLASIRKLAEHSIELAPSAAAVFRIGQFYAEQIETAEGLTSAQKTDYAKNILDVIARAEGFINTDVAQADGKPFDYMVLARYYFWRTYLFGVAALVTPSHLDSAKASLDELKDYSENAGDGKGNVYPLIATRLPHAYAIYATALMKVKGEAGNAEIAATLDALIALVEKNPDLHSGEYLALVRSGAEVSRITPEKASKNYIALAEIHPPFKAFLEKYGWQF